MSFAAIKRGLVAGLLAGLLAGAFSAVFAEPSVDAAIVREEALAAQSQRPSAVPEAAISRTVQKVGLVVGTGIVGLGIGAMFGLAATWALGRLQGDSWQRARNLGLAAVLILVALPGLKYPPNPPGIGDAATIATRTNLYLGLLACGFALAAAAWTGLRELREHGWPAPRAQALIAGLVILAAATLTLVLPDLPGTGDIPADLLWGFRVSALATQTLLIGGTAVVYGLLDHRAEAARATPDAAQPA